MTGGKVTFCRAPPSPGASFKREKEKKKKERAFILNLESREFVSTKNILGLAIYICIVQ